MVRAIFVFEEVPLGWYIEEDLALWILLKDFMRSNDLVGINRLAKDMQFNSAIVIEHEPNDTQRFRHGDGVQDARVLGNSRAG